MKYRELPQTDLALSEISFGCMSLGADHAFNNNLLNSAVDQGINYFDTADLYQNGENEITVGKSLRSRRQEVIIATKVGNQMREDGSGWDWNPTKEYILQAVEKSLKRLQTDYIDLYQLHGGTIEDQVEETIEAFEILKGKGLIKQYGISSIRPNVIRRWTEQSNTVSTMLQYSLLDRRPEENTLEFLGKKGVGVIVRGALAKGILAGKPVENYLGHQKEEITSLLEQMGNISERTLTNLSLNYVLDSEEVTTIALGIRTEQQLKQALDVANSDKLSTDQVTILKKSIKALQYEAHR